MSLKNLRKHERGFVLVWTALFLIAGLGMTALAVDLGFAYVVSNELKSVADAGALMAASTYLTQLREATAQGIDPNAVNEPAGIAAAAAIKASVQGTVANIVGRSRVLNLAAGTRINVTVELGTYDNQGQPYTEGNPDGQFSDETDGVTDGSVPLGNITAFRVIASRGGNGSRLQFSFAQILGLPRDFNVRRESVATMSPRNFVFVIDTSGSMDDLTFPPGLGDTLPINAPEAFVIMPPFSTDPFTPWFSPLAPAPAAEAFLGFNPTTPEPLQTVLNSSLAFLTALSQRIALGDSAGISYFSNSTMVKIPLIPLTPANITASFQPLLTNQSFYSNLIQGPATNIDGDPNPQHYVLSPGIADFDFALGQYQDPNPAMPLIPNVNGPIAMPHGETNIGGAINLGIQNIQNAQAFTPQSISIIILMTDGQPTCAPDPGPTDPVTCFGINATADELQRARDFTFAQARTAIQQGILVYPITYGNIDAQTLLLMDEIANLSGLANGHFQAGVIADQATLQAILNNFFNEITQLIPFSLVG